MTARPEIAAAHRDCPTCRSTVPAEVFCGNCGAVLDASASLRHILLRPNIFAAAPRQPIWLAAGSTSLFPRLSEASRRPFQLGVLLILAAIGVFSWLQLKGPLVVVTALGVPLLFVVYLWQSDAVKDIPVRALAAAVVIGVTTGSTWWLWAGLRIAHNYGIPLSVGAQLVDSLSIGLLVTAIGALLMMLPAIVVRLLGWTSRESLDGLVVGALGALSHAAAGTIAWLAPQFITGLLDNFGPARLFEEALLYGFTDPITAAAAGGLIGLELWFRPNRRTLRHPRRLRAALVIFSVLIVSLYVSQYLVDIAELPTFVEVCTNFMLTAVVLLTLRFAVQMALLHEEPDPASGRLTTCLHCARVVPEMPFCPDCGAAARASSRTWRSLRRTVTGAGRPAS